MTKNLLEVHDLSIDFRLHAQGKIRAVRGVSFRIRPGSTVALVGESGSGKSVISQAIMGVLPESAELSGQILFDDRQAGNHGGALPPALDIAALDAYCMPFLQADQALDPLHDDPRFHDLLRRMNLEP